MTHTSSHTKRIISVACMVVFVLGIVSIGLFVSQKNIQAQGVEAVTAVAQTAAGAAEGVCPTSGAVTATCPAKGIRLAIQTVGEKIASPAFRIAIIQAIMNLSRFVLDRLAYEAAVAIASGGVGEESLFYNKTAAEGFGQLGLEAAGEAVATISDLSSEALGVQFNLCAPTDPLISLGLAIGITQKYQPSAPRCNILEVGKAWGSFFTNIYQTVSDPDAIQEAILSEFAKSLKPGKNELSATLRVNIAVDGKVREQKLLQLMGLNKSDYKPVTDFITGNVKTPSATVQGDFEGKLTKNQEAEGVKVGDLANAGDLIGGLALSTASTFTNTLLSTLFSRIYTGLFDTALEIDPFDVEAIAEGGKKAAQERFASIISTAPIATQQYNALSEFVVCQAEGTTNRGLNSCVMDVNLMAAVTRGSGDAAAAMTVQEAIDEGLLNGDWPLISPEDQSSNQDPYCYTYGYCYGNLVKLRKARIISIGWELAALRNDTGSPATLQEIIDGFDDCTQEGTIGPASTDNSGDQWCHLIDPNWVIKYPDTQCRAIANGEIRLSTITPGRQSVCVDTPSCIGENNDGECSDGYGYCVQEENVWRFRGDECPEEYATCLSFENTFTGDTGSYLASTVEDSVCSSDNAGCRWYATQKFYEDAGTADDDEDDSFEWLPDGETYDTAAHDSAWKYQDSAGATETAGSYSYTSESGTTYTSASYAFEDRIYLTNDVSDCSEDDVGCTALNEFDDDLVLNHVQNPSFEDDEDEDDFPDAWINGAAAGSTQTMLEDDAVYGSFSFSTDASVLQQYVSLAPNNFYTLSFSARADNTAASTTTVSVFLYDEDGTAVAVAGTSYGGDCTPSTSSYAVTLTPSSTTQFTSGEWSSFDCTFTTPEDVAQGLLQMSSDEILLDAIQLELGEDVNDFTEGYSTSPTEVYYQVAPDYLGCTGDETDPSACDDYAQVCSAQEVGCNLYTPEDGDPDVPAIISELDECPEECVGYTTYKQEATDYDSEEFPLYFIADRASACSSQYIGCDSYTNLDAVDAGGEGTETYSALRYCLSEDIADGTDKDKTPATFFTWEGSDNEGYQLQTWYLLESGVTGLSGLFVTSGTTEVSPGLAPCMHVTMTSENEVACADTNALLTTDVWGSSTEAGNIECDEHDDIFDNPNCREFFDTEGNIHYREYPETISISDECAPYRKDESTEDDCDASGGYWTDQGFCRYYVLADESTECPAEQSGCREYTGGTGRNATTILSETFEDGTYDDFVIFEATGATSTLSVSNESIATEGHSLAVSAASGLAGFDTIQIYLDSTTPTETYDEAGDAAATSTTCTGNGGIIGDTGCEVDYDVDGDGSADEECVIEDGEESCGTLTDSLVSGKTFVVDFWAKGSGNFYATFVEKGGNGTIHDLSNPTATISSPSALTAIALTGSWQLYSLGPLDTSTYATFDENAILRFAVAAGAEAYIDNLTLKQVEEDITIIKDSWVVPSTCDATPAGVESDQYYLGCEAYTDQNGADVDLYQFTSLCSEDVVGCEGFFHTGNAASAYTQVYNARCMYSSDADFGDDPELAPANTTCAIDEVEYCTISAGESFCTFDAESELAQPLPREATGTEYFAVVYGPETVVVPADSPVYLVVNDNFACDDASIGCQELGLPTFNQDQSEVDSFESVYYLNLPADYDTLLCDDEALFCEEWSSTQDGNFYFKDPLDKTCEYQPSITIDNQEYEGWFRTGTTEPCYWTDAVDDGGDFDPDVDDSYLIGGDTFGVWANGDDDYDNWIGACEDAYDLCTEFVDVVDTGGGLNEDGSSYYFTNDDLLSEDTLTDNQRCNGQVSQKNGCALFNNTTESELRYNAGASYVISIHADVFFGEPANSLQDPIDCEIDEGGEFTLSSADAEVFELSSETVDLCARRCVYELDSGDLIETGSEQVIGSTDFYLERSCLSDTDCPILNTRLGEDEEGTCEDVATTLTSVLGDDDDLDEYVLGNDTNEVLKVNRDRQCAAWLACESDKPNWNEETARYDLICEEVSLCTAGEMRGDTAVCTNWDVGDPEILSVYDYAARDVNWSGFDYSGYAIPNQLPIETYAQFNIEAQTVCSSEFGIMTNENGFPTACSTYEDCGIGTIACTTDATCLAYGTSACVSGFCTNSCDNTTRADDYRLAYNAGSCDFRQEAYGGVGNGGSCYVGHCEDSGAACATTSDCSTSEECVVGYCQTVGDTNCVNDDCSCDPDDASACATETTSGGLRTTNCDPIQRVCVDYLTDGSTTREACVESADCAAAAFGAACVTADTSTRGSCFNNACVSDIIDANSDGLADPLNTTDALVEECRGYPEITSPFTDAIVESWVTYNSLGVASTSTDASAGAQPYAFRSGFKDSEVCSVDESTGVVSDCDCSYDKAEYANGTSYRYFEVATSLTDIPDGVCSGGMVAGIPCTSDTECTIGTNVGTCSFLDGVSTYYGWSGYCIEKDTSIQTLGSDNDEDRACLTWLPVDQLSNSTDLYAKYTSAGYAPQETYYCADIEPAYNVQTSNIACAEVATSTGTCSGGSGDWDTYADVANDVDASGWDGCLRNVWCPNSYFAVMTGCGLLDEQAAEEVTGTKEDGYCTFSLSGGNPGTDISSDDEDCPYFCVPKFSYKTQDDTSHDSTWEEGARCLTPGAIDYAGSALEIQDSAHIDGTGDGAAIQHYFDSDIDLRVYVVGPVTFGRARDYYNDCKVKGILDVDEYLSHTSSIDTSENYYGKTTGTCAGGGFDSCGFHYTNHEVTGAQQEYFMNAESYPVCSTLVQVSSTEAVDDAHGFKTYNAAWTDRLWESSTAGFSVDDSLKQSFGYSYETLRSPFGAATDPIDLAAEFAAAIETDPYAHEPVSCYDTSYYVSTADPNSCSASGSSPTSTSGEDARSFLSYSLSYLDPGVDGTSFSEGGETVDDAIARLSQLFGRIYGMYQFDDGYDDVNDAGVAEGALTDGFDAEPFGSWEALDMDAVASAISGGTLNDWLWDTRSVGDDAEGTNPPTIVSVSTCHGSECEEGSEGKFTVNGVDSDTVEGAETLAVSVSFFAYANENQMPIRRIIVDWGDDFAAITGSMPWPTGSQSGSDAEDNFYKNARGLSPTNEDEEICQPDLFAGNFGVSSDACDTSYVTYNHYYTCTPGWVEVMSAAGRSCEYDTTTGRLLNSPCLDNGECVFQPRVHVMDNWGWCTGFCDTGADGTDGCFSGETEVDDVNVNVSECDITNCPSDDLSGGTSSSCEDGDSGTSNPWINFDGTISIIPD